jgi:hypothetical protein
MMTFRTIPPALLVTLGAAAASRFTVEGYDKQSHAVEELLNDLRHVTVLYSSGQMQRAASAWVSGPVQHECTFPVELLVAADAKADLTVLNDTTSTALEYTSALAAMQPAAKRANDNWDELFDLVWNILMAPANMALGLAAGVVANRWCGNPQKAKPFSRGKYILVSGTFDYTCTVQEYPTGVVGVAGESVDLSMTVTADLEGTTSDPAKQGAEATQP